MKQKSIKLVCRAGVAGLYGVLVGYPLYHVSESQAAYVAGVAGAVLIEQAYQRGKIGLKGVVAALGLVLTALWLSAAGLWSVAIGAMSWLIVSIALYAMHKNIRVFVVLVLTNAIAISLIPVDSSVVVERIIVDWAYAPGVVERCMQWTVICLIGVLGTALWHWLEPSQSTP